MRPAPVEADELFGTAIEKVVERDVSGVADLVLRCPELLRMKTRKGNSMLHFAQCPKITRVLLNLGADGALWHCAPSVWLCAWAADGVPVLVLLMLAGAA
jgi:hypothetical protein